MLPAPDLFADQQRMSLAFIEFENERLTVRVQGMPLGELLQKIAAQSDLLVVGAGAGDQTVSIQFNQLPLDRALRRIMQQQSFAMEYSGRDAARRATTKLWFLTSGGHPVRMDRLEFARPEPARDTQSSMVAGLASPASDKTMDADLWEWSTVDVDKATGFSPPDLDSGFAVAQAAIETLVNIGGDDAANALQIGLQHTDILVRRAAVEGLGRIDGPIAIHYLVQALANADAPVRDAAATLLLRLEMRASFWRPPPAPGS